MSDFGIRFGELVASKREDHGWSLAQLAIETYGDDGLGGENRKSDVLKLEQGKSRKPNAATIRKYRLALNLTREEIDACRSPAEVQLAHFADRMFEVIDEAARQAGLSQDLAVALSERYAEGSPDDFDGALAGLRDALTAAAREKALEGASNYGGDIDALTASVDELNEAGQIDEADATLEAELDRRKAERERQAAEDRHLLTKAVAQALLTGNVAKFADRFVDLARMEYTDPERLYHFVRGFGLEQQKKGQRFGTPMTLEISTELYRRCETMAPTPILSAIAQNDLGIALRNQGTRTAGADGTRLLAEAVAAYRAALTVRAEAGHPVQCELPPEIRTLT